MPNVASGGAQVTLVWGMTPIVSPSPFRMEPTDAWMYDEAFNANSEWVQRAFYAACLFEPEVIEALKLYEARSRCILGECVGCFGKSWMFSVSRQSLSGDP